MHFYGRSLIQNVVAIHIAFAMHNLPICLRVAVILYISVSTNHLYRKIERPRRPESYLILRPIHQRSTPPIW